MNPKLQAAIQRRQNTQIMPCYQAFRGASLAALTETLAKYAGACELRIHNTTREDGIPDAWWEVIPTDPVALNGDDPPSGNESHPCPPLC